MYLNLVKYLASRFRNRGEPIDDLIQVGTIGLIKAIDRFDIEREVEFTTYATPTIVGELKRYFRDKGWAIKVPRRLQELSFRVNQAVDALTQKQQRSPTIAEIAEYLGRHVRRGARGAGDLRGVQLRLARERPQQGRRGLASPSSSTSARTTSSWRSSTTARRSPAALKDLTPQEQHVLYLRFFEGLTQTEIAKQLRHLADAGVAAAAQDAPGAAREPRARGRLGA